MTEIFDRRDWQELEQLVARVTQSWPNSRSAPKLREHTNTETVMQATYTDHNGRRRLTDTERDRRDNLNKEDPCTTEQSRTLKQSATGRETTSAPRNK